MAKAERNMTIVGWVLPGTAKKRTLSRERVVSGSSSILHHRPSREMLKSPEPVNRAARKSVTIIEGKRKLMLYLEEDQEEATSPQPDSKVMMQVDFAANGIEG